MRRGQRGGARASAVGVDTGGTFTDFVAVVGGRLVAFKLPSTPRAPERAVLDGLKRVGAGRDTRVRHGSTVATNTLLERKGARVALVTNAGFEDLIEIARQDRPDLYALAPRRTEPLVPADRRIGVRARRDGRGRELVALKEAEIRRALGRLRRARPEAVAVGLLHSHADPKDERRLGRAIRTRGLPVTVSAELCPEIREYERLATTVVNAYLQPRVGRYIEELQRSCGARLEIVLSHGGVAPADRASREPVRQLLSGPAAGLLAAFRVALHAGFGPTLTLDVGGTSTDVAFARGRLPRRRSREIAGFPILLPLLDVHTVGAGGGSIAAVDPGGLLSVGPESAGADPGPACYGRGGPATVTDALLVLGRLPVTALGDGAIVLERERAHAALARLARSLRVRSAAAAARAVLVVANARMEAALRRVTVERGHDPRDAVLVAFGGAGGLHACELAETLGVTGIVFPANAGVLSAWGALTGLEHVERSHSILARASDPRVAREVENLQREVDRTFRRSGMRISARSVLARYVGQSHELEVPFVSDLAQRFHQEHRSRFGFAREGAEIEVVTVQVEGSIAVDDVPRLRSAPTRGKARPESRTRAHLGDAALEVPVWRFESLERGSTLRGPAIVLQSGATLWVGPGWNGRLHRSGALILRRGRGR